MSESSESTPVANPGNLTLKKRPSQEESSPPAPPPRKPNAVSKKEKKKRKKRSTRFRLRSLGLSLGSFLLGVIILGTFLAHQTQEWGIVSQEQALLIRNIGLASFLVVLILEAFTEDILQGVLSLFLLPYALFYGLFVADAGPIRGLTVATLLFLGAEMYYTPDEAVVPVVHTQINDWIRAGQDKLIYPDGRPEAGYGD